MIEFDLKPNELLLIGDSIVKLKFIAHNGNKGVKLGFEAPPDIAIWREELTRRERRPPRAK